ncbi:MAG: phenylacetate--CoA ligase family protein [Planctomycetes bacterium]|nr:phenylacetate--CoA ligase family protein [Planctomycetota bacterium]
MSPAFLGRATDLLRAAALRWGSLRRAERASRGEILALQRARLARLLEHAARRSPFYVRRWGGKVPAAEDLGSLEPISKRELLGEGLEEALTDRSLTREKLRGYLGLPGRHPYVVLATSGTTGEPAIVPYSRREWIEGLACSMRGQARHSPGLLGLLKVGGRMASVATQNPIHASTQLARSFELVPGQRLAVPAGELRGESLRRLEAFGPAMLAGYPSAMDALARETLEGRLRIGPRVVLTGGETVSPALRERVRAAWGAEVFDCYGLTETLVIAWECREHRGLHIDEDAVVLEPVDEEDRPVAPGERGSAVLVTNLFNGTLPVIRYRVGDMLGVSDEPCPCGLPFARIVSIEGRREEVLELRGADGALVAVSPTVVETPLEVLDGVRRFQLHAAEGVLTVVVAPRGGSAEGREHRERLGRAVEEAVARALAPHGVAAGSARVEVSETLEDERGATDKRRRVLRDAR